MINKKIIVYLLVFMSFLFKFDQVNAMDTPEKFADIFFHWYIKNDTPDAVPEDSKDIYKFVSSQTIDRIKLDEKRGTVPGGANYFTRVQDYQPSEWLETMVIHKATFLSETVIVPVTFGKNDKVDVILFLKKQGDSWRIIKVDDAIPYP